MSDSKAGEPWSKRAQILKRVLDWVNQGRYEPYDSWMIFGCMGADTTVKPPLLYEKGDAKEDTSYEMISDLQVQAGRLSDARRTSLDGRPPKPNIRGMEEASTSPDWRSLPEPDRSEVADYLDAKFSLEVVEKLEKIVRRATLLDPHEVEVSQINDYNVRACFSEAHRCYLYGFNAACAVMCREILECALKAKLDPDQKIEFSLKRGQSLLKELITLAELDKPLPGAPPDVTGVDVKRSGDSAAHDYGKFQKEYESQGKMEDILHFTRAALVKLYPRSSDED